MRYYKLTVLKDLPGFNKGEEYHHVSEKEMQGGCIVRRNNKEIQELIYYVDKHPEFVKSEIDINSAVDVTCPQCHNTKMFPNHKSSSKYDCDVRYYYKTISLVCAKCGHEQEIYTFQSDYEVECW